MILEQTMILQQMVDYKIPILISGLVFITLSILYTYSYFSENKSQQKGIFFTLLLNVLQLTTIYQTIQYQVRLNDGVITTNAFSNISLISIAAFIILLASSMIVSGTKKKHEDSYFAFLFYLQTLSYTIILMLISGYIQT